jgi:transcriptional antiterminator NusG
VAFKWYIVHVYSGFENKVKAALEERIASSPHPEKFGEVLVPT